MVGILALRLHDVAAKRRASPRLSRRTRS